MLIIACSYITRTLHELLNCHNVSVLAMKANTSWSCKFTEYTSLLSKFIENPPLLSQMMKNAIIELNNNNTLSQEEKDNIMKIFQENSSQAIFELLNSQGRTLNSLICQAESKPPEYTESQPLSVINDPPPPYSPSNNHADVILT